MATRVLSLDRRRAAPREVAPAEAWNTGAYLAEYYSRLEPTELHTMSFLQRVLAGKTFARVLDFGAGPTLHHAIQLAGYAQEVHVADFSTESLRAILRWQMRSAGAHDWSPFTRYALRLAGVADDSKTRVLEQESLVRRRLKRVMHGDARRRQPLGERTPAYDLVTSFFCADSITANLDDWRQYTRNIASVTAPGGWLVLGALRRCTRWRHCNRWLPSPCIDEVHMRFVLDCAGFDQQERQFEVVDLPDQSRNGFDSMLLVCARAPRAGP